MPLRKVTRSPKVPRGTTPALSSPYRGQSFLTTHLYQLPLPCLIPHSTGDSLDRLPPDYLHINLGLGLCSPRGRPQDKAIFETVKVSLRKTWRTAAPLRCWRRCGKQALGRAPHQLGKSGRASYRLLPCTSQEPRLRAQMQVVPSRPGGSQEAASGNRRGADANSPSLPIGVFHTDRLPGV